MINWFEKAKELTKDKKGRRRIENLVIILILGVIIIIVASSFFGGDGDKNIDQKRQQEEIAYTSNKPFDELMELEERLEQILSEIEGAGIVKVMITGVSDGEVVHAYNQMEESRFQEEHSGTESYSKTDEVRQEQELVFMDNGSGIRSPVVTKRIKPEIKGVVVVADGAGNIAVRQNITGAVEALTGIPTYRIQVIKRK